MHHNPSLLELRCTLCGKGLQPSEEILYTCPMCGPMGTLEMLYDYEALACHWARREGQGLGRYVHWLPIRQVATLPPLLVGDTPLSRVDRLGHALGLQHLFVKEDQRNPTASCKDRASALVVAAARDRGIDLITGASTGNAACSLAGLSASVGLRSVIFVPQTAPDAKVVQLLIYGADVLLVSGSYDDAFELSLEATRQFGWFNRNTGYNPMTLEGKKTIALEIFEQCPEVDAVFVAVGDGCVLGGLGKGFQDLHRAGLLPRLPRLFGVQAAGSSVLSKAFAAGQLLPDPGVCTYADSICVGAPRVAHHALSVVKASEGNFVVVSDDEIRDAQRWLARQTGIFAEPAGAASVAGLRRALEQGWIGASERVVSVVTGHGLKDVRGALSAVRQQAHRISSDPAQLCEELRRCQLLSAAR